MNHRSPNTKAWLWWLAFFFLILGSAITYLISLGDETPAKAAHFGLGVALTAIVFGVCVISATANWWLHR